MRAIRFGRIEKRHTMIERRPNDIDHLGTSGDRRLIGSAHVLHADADTGDLE
jgi:hypothetical protein